MYNSKRTLKDLSFTGSSAEGNIMNFIDRCTTFAGSTVLQRQLSKAPSSHQALREQQDAVRFWSQHPEYWTKLITNGTIVMLEKFFESADTYSAHPGGGMLTGKLFQKLFNRNEYHFTQFSLSHLSDFIKGCIALVSLAEQATLPVAISRLLDQMRQLLDHRLTKDLLRLDKHTPFREVAQLSFHARREMKSCVHELIDCYALLDAWNGMAIATTEHHWTFPELLPAAPVCLQAEKLYHPLLTDAVHYDIGFAQEQNFMILTGANMSGKTTLMRALGVAAILAHLGMGVPASSMKISFLEGVMTNMHVEDDLMKGESFFLAEVKSMKQTAEAVARQAGQLILMDELFKGTNVHDAYECTKAIVEGLLKHPQHIMILSTHLHEVAHFFEQHSGIRFYCFSTTLGSDGNFRFNYQLREGISDERIGYKILVKEGIVDILNQNTPG